jgi:hypothetical protein
MSKRFVPYLILSLFFIATIFIFGQNRDINLNVSAETTVVSQCSTRTSVNDSKRDNCEWSRGKWYTDTCICVCPTGFYDYYGTGSCAKLSTTSTVSNTTSTISSTTTIPTTTTTTGTTTTDGTTQNTETTINPVVTNTTTTGTVTSDTTGTNTTDQTTVVTTSVCDMTTTLNKQKYANCTDKDNAFIGTWNTVTCSCKCPTGTKDVYSTGSCVYYGTTTTNQCTYTPAEWSACIDGQQKITECIEGKYQTRTRSCGEIQKCERDEWSCDSSWGICVNGIQKRECKKTFDCYIADNPPATERSCIDTKISGTRIITETSKVEKRNKIYNSRN